MPEHRDVSEGGEQKAPLLPSFSGVEARRSINETESGFNILELVVALSVLGLLSLFGVPALMNASAELRVKLAAHEVSTVLTAARWDALRYGANVGVKFYPEPGSGLTHYRVYRDGDGDGVRTADIKSGIDPPMGALRRLNQVAGSVTLGFPPGIDAPAPGPSGGSLGNLDDPIRFNRSDIASFTGIGGATPGTIYLTDGRTKLSAVRVYNRTGKIMVVHWDSHKERWSR